jgi:hypothetical protein
MSELDLWVPTLGGSVASLRTGETFDLATAEWSQLAGARRAITDLRPVLGDAARVLDGEITRRLDRNNDRSIDVDGYEVRVKPPTESEWDITLLRENLDQLVNEGRLGAGVPGRAVKVEVSYKPVAVELKRLLDHDDPRVKELVGECRTVRPAERRVTVTRR